MPIGKRPRPSVAAGPKPKWNVKSGEYSGVRGTKSPTGSRPVPSVAKNRPNPNTSTNAGRPAAKVTRMPTPRRDQTTGASKATGG